MPGLVSDRRLWRDTGLPHNPSAPSPILADSPLANASAPHAVVDGTRRPHDRRQFAMASRTRSTTVVDRPGAGPSVQPLRRLGLDTNKRMSRDDMDIAQLRPRKADYEKRISRDDLAITTRQFDRANYRSYHIPIRGKPPSPETSPKDPAPPGLAVRTTTPDSMDGRSVKGETGVIAIGMALGSPAHPREPSLIPWHSQAAAASQAKPSIPSAVTSKGATATNMTAVPPIAVQQEAPKSRKWGIFGRSRSKRGRTPETASPSSSAAATPNPTAVRSGTFPGASPGKSKHTPIIAQVPPVPAIPQSRFLDVEIPDITMERYSVMFSGVLEPQQTSSLLARRQATLDRLKNIREALPDRKDSKGPKDKEEVTDEWPRPQISTGGHSRRSPSFTLFPATPNRVNPNLSTTNLALKASPLARSNTSPGLLPSPSRTTFPEPKASSELSRPKFSARYLDLSQASPRTTTPRDDLQSTPRSHLMDVPLTAHSLKSLESFTPTPAEPDVHIRDKLHPTVAEPAWQMVTSPGPMTSGPSEISAHKPRPSSISSERMTVAAQDTTSSSSTTESTAPEQLDDHAKQALEDAVEISIARQISISQQQRKLLRPLQTATSVRRKEPSPYGVGIATKMTLGRKGSTPTLIHPPDQGEALTHRKSSRGVLEAI
ncbi:hypothetical protein S40293_07043 [Stachybotrys chartarum IBT 40293]|nr:hypothetical protein S40293_07043 [Stachybotrys chartarum IBT 40293]